jgi:hypothetical protein
MEKKFSIKKGKLLTSHRSTFYPCCDQALGDSKGAGHIRLARMQIYTYFLIYQLLSLKKFIF